MGGHVYKDEAKGRWYGAVSLGYGPDGKTWRRHKVSGRTRAEVVEKLKQLQVERDSGVQPDRAYTVRRAVDDWLTEGLDGRSAKTVGLNRGVLKLVTAIIGDVELRKLTAHDVRPRPSASRAGRSLPGCGAGSSSSRSHAAADVSPSTVSGISPPRRHLLLGRYVISQISRTPECQPANVAPHGALLAAIRTELGEALEMAVTLPELRAPMLGELTQSTAVIAGALAERAGRPPGDPAALTCVGAVFGIILAVIVAGQAESASGPAHGGTTPCNPGAARAGLPLLPAWENRTRAG